MQRLLGERAASTAAGQWVIGRGYDQTLLQENRHPTRDDLDRAVPDHPAVIFHISYHGLVANSVALQMAGMDASTENVAGGEIMRDVHGVPTGVSLESPAMSLVSGLMPKVTVERMRSGLGNARDQFMPLGISAVHDALIHSRDEIDAYAAAMSSGELPMRAYRMIAPISTTATLRGSRAILGCHTVCQPEDW